MTVKPRPRGGICMKLSIDGFRTCGGCFGSTHICSQYVRGCPSDSQGLSPQPFSGVTRVGEQAAPCECRLHDRRHPPRCQGLEMAHAFAQAQLALLRAPEVRTQRWAERLREHPAQHTTIQITPGGVFCGGRENGAMESTLPGRTNALDGPAPRRAVDDGSSLPSRVRHMGTQEVPGHQRQVSLRRSSAVLLGLLLGRSPTFMHERFGDA
jgi:hypothetical protein